MPILHRRHGQDKTVLYGQDKTVLLCLVGGVNRVGYSLQQFSVVINILKTEQFCPVLSAV